MDAKGNVRNDVRLPEDSEVDDDVDLCKRIREFVDNGKECIVTVLGAMGIEKIVEAKEA
jgi:hypothetical protein